MTIRHHPAVVLVGLALCTALGPGSAHAGVPMQHGGSWLGEAPGDQAGISVAGVLDVNGDGYDDLLVGVPKSDWTGVDSGIAYLIAGGATGWGLDTPLAAAMATFLGEAAGDEAGMVISGAGDVNADGLYDLLIAAPNNAETSPVAGQVYLVLGRVAGWMTGVSLSTADASFTGECSVDHAGEALAAAGDVDGDGLDDFLIAAADNGEVATGAGQVYLVLGRSVGWAMDAGLVWADASFLGESGSDCAGQAVAGIGDLDGDGLSDLVIGASGNSETAQRAGQVYVVMGRDTGWAMDQSLSSAEASFLGEADSDYAGFAVASPGDTDGDGYDDLLVGARGNDAGGPESGQVYLFLGRATGWSMDTPLANADASFVGEWAYDELGRSLGVATAPTDLDGDGLADLLLGAQKNDAAASQAGKMYVFFGNPAGWAMGTLAADADAYFLGEAQNDETGYSIASAGDVDGDGLSDLLVGSPYNDESGADAGQAYLVLGFPCDDLDGDGLETCDGDCDDSDPSVFPGAPETPNGVDDDCDGDIDEGTVAYDDDGDGVTEQGGDCDDADAMTFPGAVEICDGLDNDCDGQLAEYEADDDGDGYLFCEDCNDQDAAVHPDATEDCHDLIDSDCEDDLQETEVDDDLDGFAECDEDCDDTTATVNPGMIEICNGGIDDDCDPLTDESADSDGDGWDICIGDCDDTSIDVFPEAPELCDGVDNNCNGQIDDGVDDDGDGYDGCGGEDCDDTDPDIHPDSWETPYDGIDQDCDGADQTDLDGDGYDGGLEGEDCDDSSAGVHPGAPEDCDDGYDNDCDGTIDERDMDCGEEEEEQGGCSCSASTSAASISTSQLQFLIALLLVAGRSWVWGRSWRTPPAWRTGRKVT
jgi:hypothetical protein